MGKTRELIGMLDPKRGAIAHVSINTAVKFQQNRGFELINKDDQCKIDEEKERQKRQQDELERRRKEQERKLNKKPVVRAFRF